MRDTQPVPAVKAAPKLSLVEAACAQYESALARPLVQPTSPTTQRERAQERLHLLQSSGLHAAPVAANPTRRTKAMRAAAQPSVWPLHLAWGAVCAVLVAALAWQSNRPDATAPTPRAPLTTVIATVDEAAPPLRLSTTLSQPATQP
jgi:hypothetical protein